MPRTFSGQRGRDTSDATTVLLSSSQSRVDTEVLYTAPPIVVLLSACRLFRLLRTSLTKQESPVPSAATSPAAINSRSDGSEGLSVGLLEILPREAIPFSAGTMTGYLSRSSSRGSHRFQRPTRHERRRCFGRVAEPCCRMTALSWVGTDANSLVGAALSSLAGRVSCGSIRGRDSNGAKNAPLGHGAFFVWDYLVPIRT